MFWDKYVSLCSQSDIKPRTLAREMGASSATVTDWKNGAVPGYRTLAKIAEYFNVSIDYLVNEEDIDIRVADKRMRGTFKTLYSLPQRWASLRGGHDVSSELLTEIAKYVNCDIFFLITKEDIAYKPQQAANANDERAFDTETLHSILDIMDCCADTDGYRFLQIQLSRIVLFHLNNAGITREQIETGEHIDLTKLKYLYEGTESKDKTLNYGLNYSDLSMIRKITGLSYQYMFTGIKKSARELYEELKANK